MRKLRALLGDESGELLFIALLTFSLGATAIVGGAKMMSAAEERKDAAKAGAFMAETGRVLEQKFESSETLKASVPAARQAQLRRRWAGMRQFAKDYYEQADWDTNMAVADVIVDLQVSMMAPIATAGSLVKVADKVLDAKDYYDVGSAAYENVSDSSPEMREFDRRMKEAIDGRESAEEFMVPARKAAAINVIADMGVLEDHVEAVPDPAGECEIDDRMASALTRSYTQMKTSGALDDFETYEEFVRKQVHATLPSEAQKANAGQVVADPEAYNLFDKGKCDVLLANINTEQGPVLVELKREKGGRVTATSLATKEKVVAVLSEGDGKPSEEPAEGKPGSEGKSGSEGAPGETGDTGFVTPGRVGFAIAPGWNVEMDFALTVHEGGAVDGYFGGYGKGANESDYWEYIGPFQGKMDKNGKVTASGNARVTVMMLGNMSASGRETRKFKVVGGITPVEVDGKSTYRFVGAADGARVEAHAVK